jgi:hypothetical protein
MRKRMGLSMIYDENLSNKYNILSSSPLIRRKSDNRQSLLSTPIQRIIFGSSHISTTHSNVITNVKGDLSPKWLRLKLFAVTSSVIVLR